MNVVATAYPFDFKAFFDYLITPGRAIVHGIVLTIVIATVSEFLGVCLGLLAAFARFSKLRAVRYTSFLYSWAIRGTPQILLISIVYFAGIPFFGLDIFGGYRWDDLQMYGLTISGAVLAGIFALSVNEGAYMSEFIRAGITSVDPGQMEAARAIGMHKRKAMRRIILPQAARVVVPSLGNQFNIMLKVTSLLSVISVTELYTAATILQGQTFQPFEVFGAAAIYYLAITTAWAICQRFIERRVNRGWGPGSSDFRDRPMTAGPG